MTKIKIYNNNLHFELTVSESIQELLDVLNNALAVKQDLLIGRNAKKCLFIPYDALKETVFLFEVKD